MRDLEVQPADEPETVTLKPCRRVRLNLRERFIHDRDRDKQKSPRQHVEINTVAHPIWDEKKWSSGGRLLGLNFHLVRQVRS